jgi:hypothetical protein
MLRHEFRDEAWIKIINVARLGSRNYRNGFTLVKTSLSLQVRTAQQNNQASQ